jgi:hypothetical protein
MFPVVPKAELILDANDHLNRWTGAGNVIRVHLYSNNLTPTPLNVLADFTEMNNVEFPGYVPIATAPSGTPFINAVGQAEVVFTDPLFQPSADPPAPVTAYGYFVTIHPLVGADTLIYSKRFDAPVIVTFATDAVLCDPDLAVLPFTAPKTE